MAMSSIYYYGQDGLVANDTLIKEFNLGPKQIKYSDSTGKYYFDFVGFIFHNDNILTVFPKHYFTETELSHLNNTHLESNSDIKLLFDVIQNYIQKEHSNASAKSYIGSLDGYDSNYPFKAFFQVYSYFQKYGLYKEKENKIVKDARGKISWKTTIAKSNKIISEGNLIFSPFFVNKKNYNSVFLTDCMAFIIDHTIDTFHDFISMKKVGNNNKFDFIKNVDYVLAQLRASLNVAFKDVNKKLIQSMIEFFEQYGGRATGGNYHIEIKYFDMIWQKMIESYLNKHFVGIDNTTKCALFDTNTNSGIVRFDSKRFSDIDNSNHNFYIDVDHLAFKDKYLYIFDSKYYSQVNELNYKQLAYNEILRYYFKDTKEIYNILFLPGENSVNLHFSYSQNCIGSRTYGISIMEQYLEIKKIMIDYLN